MCDVSHQKFLVVKKKLFSFLVISVCNHGEYYETPCNFESSSCVPNPLRLPEPEDKRARFFETLLTLYPSTDVTFT